MSPPLRAYGDRAADAEDALREAAGRKDWGLDGGGAGKVRGAEGWRGRMTRTA